jgi:hypothetical protein
MLLYKTFAIEYKGITGSVRQASAKRTLRKTTFKNQLGFYDTFVAALDCPSPCACHFFISSTICFFIWAGVGSAMWVAIYHE